MSNPQEHERTPIEPEESDGPLEGPTGVARGASSTYDPSQALSGVVGLLLTPADAEKHMTAAYSYADLVDFLRPFDIATGLDLIGLWNAWLTRINSAHISIAGVPVTAWWLALVARALIEGGSTAGGRALGDESLLHACARAFCLHDPVSERTGRGPEEQQQVARAHRVRVAYEQFGFQHMPVNAVARAVALYRNLPRVVAADPPFDLAAAFREALGLSLERFLLIGYLLYGWVTNTDPSFRAEHLTGGGDPFVGRLWDEGSIRAFLAATSCTIEYFRHLQVAEAAEHPGLERYALNTLRQRPVIEVETGLYVVPSPQLLLERFTAGIFYDLYDHSDLGREEKPFSRYFGLLFERYVGDVLEAAAVPPTVVLPEPEYKVGKNKVRGADWGVVDEQAAALIEAKTKRLIKKSRVTGALTDVRYDLEREIGPAIAKLQTKEEHARGGLTGQTAYASVERFHRLVVVQDALYPIGILRDELDEFLAPEYDGRPYHVLWSEELECLAALVPHVPLTTLLAEWETVPARERSDLRWWLTERWKALVLGNSYPQNPYLHRIFDEWPSEHPTLPD